MSEKDACKGTQDGGVMSDISQKSSGNFEKVATVRILKDRWTLRYSNYAIFLKEYDVQAIREIVIYCLEYNDTGSCQEKKEDMPRKRKKFKI